MYVHQMHLSQIGEMMIIYVKKKKQLKNTAIIEMSGNQKKFPGNVQLFCPVQIISF